MLNPLHIFKSSSKLTIVGVIGAALNLPVSIIVANHLGPNTFGQVSFVLLWITYSGLLHIGIFEGGQREVIHRLGQNQNEQVRYYQNLSLTSELLWGLIPVSLLFAASFFFPDPIRKVGFILAPAAYLGAALSRMLGGLHFAHQRFGLYARFNLIRSLAQPLLLVGLVFIIGPYSLFIVPAIIEWGICILYLFYAPPLNLKWCFDKRAAGRLMRAGLPLGLQALVYWAYRLTGLTSVALWLSTQQLGYYAFSARLVDLSLRPFSDFGSILMPTLWTELGRAGNVHSFGQDAIRISLLLTAATCAVTNLFQAGFAPVVQLLVPRFVPSIPVFEVLSFNIIVLTIVTVPSLILDSAVVNKQWLHLNIWIGGLVINLAANYFVIRKGWGLIAVAWNDIWVQVLTIILIYKSAQAYLFHNRVEATRFYAAEVVLLFLSGLVFALLKWSPISINGGGGSADLLAALGARVAIVGLVWAGICFSLYRYHRRSGFKRLAEPTA